jgi:hypothetical protein
MNVRFCLPPALNELDHSQSTADLELPRNRVRTYLCMAIG